MDAPALKQLLQEVEAERRQMQAQNEQAAAELQELRAQRQQFEHEVAATQEILVRREQMLACQEDEIRFKDTKIAQLTHEIATLKRYRLDQKGEQLPGVQGILIEKAVEEDITAIETELELLAGVPSVARAKLRPMPEHLPRIEYRHEPDSTTCQCGCQLQRIGEDVSEKLDFIPGVLRVERHVRGKWACKQCQTLTQAPVRAHVFDKGLPSTGLLAHVLVAKYADHLPLYRQVQCALPQASMPTTQGAKFAKNVSTAARRTYRRNTALPRVFAA